jgi:hypothetical protein
MQYMVVGPDGKEYGPASIDMLKQWATENRLQPTTQLRDFGSGQLIRASSLTEIFPSQAVATMPAPQGAPPAGQWSQPPSPSNYARPMPSQPVSGDSGAGDLWGAIIRSAIALVLFFWLGRIGIFFAGYGLYYAIRAQSKGHKFGIVAIVISGITLAIVGLGLVLTLSSP